MKEGLELEWAKNEVQDIFDLTKVCKAGIGRKVNSIVRKPDDMDTLQEILDLTKDCNGGIGATIWRSVNRTMTHVTIARMAKQAGERRNH